MKIPFGTRRPNEDESILLQQIGCTVDDKTHGKYYYISLPEDSSRFEVNKNTPDFDKVHYTVLYNGTEVISVNQKTAMYDSYVYCNISKSSIDLALTKNEEFDQAQKNKPVMSDYQNELIDRLRQLENIIFEGGASRGYGRYIGLQFPYLIEFKKQNPEEHDAVIAGNPRYKKLFEMFPNWTDPNHLQATYEQRDVGPFMALSAASENGQAECRIM